MVNSHKVTEETRFILFADLNDFFWKVKVIESSTMEQV